MYNFSPTPDRIRKIIIDAKINTSKKLVLIGEGLKEFPMEILQLESLEELYLTNNEIENIPSEIRNLKELRILNLIHNKIKHIPNEIRYLTKLIQLGLNNNRITDINDGICELKYLEVLGLNNNEISTIPKSIKKLKKLKLFGLENNQIKEIPFEIVRLSNLTDLLIQNNPLQSPPIEVAASKNNIKTIKNYFLELEKYENNDTLSEVKLIIVGNGGVGKTTLTKSLINPNYKFKHTQRSTHGIEIDRWTIYKNELKEYLNNSKDHNSITDDFKLNVWDFGGQEIYHSTHQFFLTKRSVYLLITESRKEDSYLDLNYWLNIIELLGDLSPVILVLNKIDHPNKDIPIKEIKKRFPKVVDLLKTSSLPEFNHTIIGLKRKIISTILNKELLPHIDSIIPHSWIEVRKKLSKLRKSGLNYIELDEYLRISKESKLDKKQAMWLSEYLHDIGVILHFQEISELNNLIVLNHKWVTSAVYKVLDNNKITAKHGIFNFEELNTIWEENNYANKRFELLTLMQKFELCFKIENNDYLAPQLLPVDEIEYSQKSILNELGINDHSLLFEYHYKFMPKGIITRLIIKLNDLILGSHYWRYGVILKYENTLAIIKQNYFESKITISLNGKEKKEFLSIIKTKIKEIHYSFKNVEYEELIPCGCNKITNNNHYFEFKNLKKRLLLGKTKAECPVCFENCMIMDVLEGITPFNISRSVERLIKQDRITEAFDLIESKLNHINKFELDVDFIILKNRYNRIINKFSKGLIIRESFNIEKNNIIKSILNLIKTI